MIAGPPVPAGCQLRYANVTNGAQGVVLVTRHLACTAEGDPSTQEIRFAVKGNDTTIECYDSAEAASDGRGGCSPVVRGCCVRPVPLKSDDSWASAAFRSSKRVKATTAVTPDAQLGLSARSFGAVGNCSTPGVPASCHDDGPALQRAILAAQEQHRTLLVEAGSYLIGQPLVLPCRGAVKGCGVSHNQSTVACDSWLHSDRL